MRQYLIAACILVASVVVAQANTSRSCLTADTRAELAMIEARFGKVKIISTCVRKNIAGTRRLSYHSFGRAVDFSHPRKSAIVAYLKTRPVLVMTYSTHGHIHFNTGQKGVILSANGFGGGKRYVRKKRYRGSTVQVAWWKGWPTGVFDYQPQRVKKYKAKKRYTYRKRHHYHTARRR